MPTRKYTPEQKDDMVKRVDSRRAGGISLAEACKKEGVNISMYSWWKGRQQGKSYADRGARRPVSDDRAIEKIMGPLAVALDQYDAPSTGKAMSNKERYLRILERILEIED